MNVFSVFSCLFCLFCNLNNFFKFIQYIHFINFLFLIVCYQKSGAHTYTQDCTRLHKCAIILAGLPASLSLSLYIYIYNLKTAPQGIQTHILGYLWLIFRLFRPFLNNTFGMQRYKIFSTR